MVSDRPDLHYHFAILNSEEVNAFAAPGGFIFITHGMILGMESEEELAAVLAHEVGHVSARHSIASVRGALWKRVAVITAQETARHAGVNPELLDLFGEATDKIVGTLLTVGYDQGQEFEADQLGQEYAARAGYDPAATRRYLERMKQRAAGRDQTLTARLGTHPAFDKRLEKLPAKDAANLNPEAVDFRSKRFMGTIR
jgi:predicted Zn-dependent protease